MKILLPEEKDLFESIRGHFLEKRYPPSTREIKQAWGQSSTSKLQSLLGQLREKEYIAWDSNKSRTYRLLAGNMPLRGVIQAGYVVGQPTDLCTYINVSDSHYKIQDYALEVQGDSMIDAHICHGDSVILRPVEQISDLKPGDITAVWVEEEDGTTLKHVYHEKGLIVLKPANSHYEPRSYRPECVYPQGILVGLQRSYRR